ncbi:MAG: hypothetical protein RQ842_05820 [Vulcanisaeta sp.]|nr:hypothetical protein [Vulcanisaeta sp.]
MGCFRSNETPRYIAPGSRGRVLGVDPTTGRGAGRRDAEDIEKMVEEIVNEKVAEMYGRLEQLVRENFERFAEEYMSKRSIDEKAIRALVKAIVGKEIEKHRAEIEERLSGLGLDAEVIKRIIDEMQNKLLSELDRRIMHLVSIINEQGNEIKDVLDLVSALLESEVKSEEILEKLRSELSEERIEEYLYRVLVKRGIIRRRKRKWGWVTVGLGILIAIVIGLLINPILTVVVLFIVFVILMRW